MLRQHAKLVARALYATDMGVTVLSFFAAYHIRNAYLIRWDLSGLYPIEKYTSLLLLIIPIWTILLMQNQVYKSFRTSSLVTEIKAVGKAVLYSGLILGSVAFVLKLQYLSRMLIMVFIAINLILLALARMGVRSLSRVTRKHGYNFRIILIVGTNEAARDIAHRIRNAHHWGLRVLGFVSESDDNVGSVIDGHRVVGTITDLENIINREIVDEVVFADPGKRFDKFEDVFLMLEEHGVNARISARIFPHMIAKVQLDDLDSLPLLTFTTVPTNQAALLMKRLFDITMSLFLLLLSAPVMAAAALFIKTTSPGPVLFRQRRSGLNGRVFTLYKFRSMYEDAELRRKDLAELNEMTGPVFKIKDDPRVTRVGRLFRRMSIDELPQLWNVFRGDMSIVGPRPAIPDEVSQYARWQRRRLSMRPGLTCLWQVNGRNTVTDFNEWVRLDLQYIDTWSLALDMNIFIKTIPVVLLRKGAV